MKLMQIYKRRNKDGLARDRDTGHTLVLSSKRPFGVSSMMDGGLKGYSPGRRMRTW